MTPTVQDLRRQLQQLRARHEAGQINAAKYAEARAALERQLLDHVVDDPAAPVARRAGVQTWALLGGLALAVAAAGYGLTGSPDQINQLPSTVSAGGDTGGAGEKSPHEMGSAEMEALLQRLAERMEAQPDDAEGWVMLGRSYAAVGRHDDSLKALSRAIKLRPDDATVLVDFADALAVKNGRQLEGEPLQIIEKALKIEPDNLKGLALAGTAAFNRADYPKAVQYWERAAQVGPPDSPIVQMAQNGAAEARSRGKLPGAAAPQMAAAPAAGTAPAPAVAAAPGAGSVSGTVTIKPELMARLSPDDAVFIFARAAVGSRMPLALLRKQVKDLPITFTLDDSMAMSPAARISGAEKVVVGARVSKSGQAMPQPGDLEGLSEPLAPGGQGVKVVIAGELKQ
jgi:cytochrome c-type biogenesis protein CcmH